MKSRVLTGMAGVALIASLAGCSAGQASIKAEPKPKAEPTSGSFFGDVESTGGSDNFDEPETVVPDPDGKYSSDCDYVLGNFTSGPNGYRFIGDAHIHNVGNIGVVAEVKAAWFLLGGGDVKETKTVRLDVDQHKRVSFTVPATDDEIDRHQAIDSSRTCKVVVSLVDTFGQPVG